MAFQGALRLLPGDVPQLDLRVVAGGGQQFAVGLEGKAADNRVKPGPGVNQLALAGYDGGFDGQ